MTGVRAGLRYTRFKSLHHDKQNVLRPGSSRVSGRGPGLWRRAAARSSSQPRRARTGAPATPDVPNPTFRTSVNLVSSDVIVRNRRGQFQADLTKDDFEVYEDGVKQELTSFTLVHGGRVYQTQTATAAPVREGIILPPSRPVNDAAGRIIIFVIDDLHLEFRDTHRVRRLFRDMAKELVHDGDLFGIVSTGTSSIAIDLTYDRDAHGGGGQQDYRRRAEAVGNHPAVVHGRDAAGSHAPRERGLRDRVRHAEQPRSRRSIAARRWC